MEYRMHVYRVALNIAGYPPEWTLKLSDNIWEYSYYLKVLTLFEQLYNYLLFEPGGGGGKLP